MYWVLIMQPRECDKHYKNGIVLSAFADQLIPLEAAIQICREQNVKERNGVRYFYCRVDELHLFGL
jgi:hypothetical protein